MPIGNGNHLMYPVHPLFLQPRKGYMPIGNGNTILDLDALFLRRVSKGIHADRQWEHILSFRITNLWKISREGYMPTGDKIRIPCSSIGTIGAIGEQANSDEFKENLDGHGPVRFCLHLSFSLPYCTKFPIKLTPMGFVRQRILRIIILI